ncbi:DNA starvation/stationary phase protection protein Dps [Tateyamaria sp. SN3-11]|uniref:DNA starvation/stationary phase protection protein Dps n=1 Tax=Tateyamaria sp. SN3-11 TaxID=3092147 RepID=UPI0039E844D2
MRKTRLGLAANIRTTSTALLQSALTDALDLRLDVKQAHWAVRGPHFQQLHTLFDSFVAPLDAEIDQMAERIATLGAIPDGRSGSVAGNTQLEVYPVDLDDGLEHVAALADRFAALGDKVRKSIDESAEAGDADTSDLFTATSRFLDQTLWFLESHLA